MENLGFKSLLLTIFFGGFFSVTLAAENWRKLNKPCIGKLNLALFLSMWVQVGYFSTVAKFPSDLDINVIQTENI